MIRLRHLVLRRVLQRKLPDQRTRRPQREPNGTIETVASSPHGRVARTGDDPDVGQACKPTVVPPSWKEITAGSTGGAGRSNRSRLRIHPSALQSPWGDIPSMLARVHRRAALQEDVIVFHNPARTGRLPRVLLRRMQGKWLVGEVFDGSIALSYHSARRRGAYVHNS